MKVLIKNENFSVLHYELSIKDAVLEFAGEQPFSLLYSQIMDFVITQDRHGKLYFTMAAMGRLYEGVILETQDMDGFAAQLKEKLDGVINIEIRRN